MDKLLNAYEVLTIAQTIEENGAKFYREAAKLHKAEADTSFLLRLADMEDDHKNKFTEMQQALSPVIGPDPDILASVDEYLKALSDSTSLEGSIFASYLFSGDEALSDIVMIGIDLEKETILYYLGLKDLFTKKQDLKVIDAIIQEEKSHIGTLIYEYRILKTTE